MGLIIHAFIDMLPLFYGVDIAVPGAPGVLSASSQWMFFVFYFIPMLLMLGGIYLSSRWYKIINLVFACLAAIVNIVHLCTDFAHDAGIQALLLTFVLFVSGLLVFASYRWYKGPSAKQHQ
ncbi:MAG TPA: hypothetical protein DEF88_10330 [Porphyromonadaceae bacterium]|nr:hypothetical protein [Porphyromonadaceae bacterium]HBX20829.1 hypothetical protein [Porphyromonadaceae bacterium]